MGSCAVAGAAAKTLPNSSSAGTARSEKRAARTLTGLRAVNSESWCWVIILNLWVFCYEDSDWVSHMRVEAAQLHDAEQTLENVQLTAL